MPTAGVCLPGMEEGPVETNWIQTYSGRKFYPLSPRVGDIFIEDIAHSLSMLCRFNGHSRIFYSVAEHSVRVSKILPPNLQLWGLLHDSAEAYLSDIPRPLKKNFREFREVEDALLEVIARRFGLSWPMPAEVVEADNRLLATEARDLMAPHPEPWNLPFPPLAERIVPLGPAEAEAAFLARFRELIPPNRKREPRR